jgi:hypothetical protein
MKKFVIPCNFGGQVIPVDLYVGNPNPNQHPLSFQSKWLSDNKGGQIPADIMDSIDKIHKIALKNNVSFEELCFYAINIANEGVEKEIPQFNKLLLELV